MPEFSDFSKANLSGVHPKLKALFERVIQTVDCQIICGFRSQKDQDAAVATGNSKTPWPTSKHNTYPSLAVDAAPYPVDWTDEKRFYLFAGYVKGIAEGMGLKIRYGGDWNGDFNLKDQTFFDLDHFELVEDNQDRVDVDSSDIQPTEQEERRRE